MSLAAHAVAFLFAVPAGFLTYIVHIAAQRSSVNTTYLLAIVILLGIPLIGMPSLAYAILFYYLIGMLLGFTAVYGHTFLYVAANYGLGNAIRAIGNLSDTVQQGTTTPAWPTGQTTPPDPDPPDDDDDGEGVWIDQ